jgi:deoxyribodipyrimidine photo-lyase
VGETAIMVFTRDLRLHDNPALAAAAETAAHVVPVFVRDTRLAATGFATPAAPLPR